jgi:hypothetical protein
VRLLDLYSAPPPVARRPHSIEAAVVPSDSTIPSPPGRQRAVAWYSARSRVYCAILALAAATIASASPSDRPTTQPALRAYDTRYYRIYCDLPDAAVREAEVRMTRMAEEYHARTADFAGQITERLPFYLYATAEEYHAAGGPEGTAGFFDGRVLRAVAGRTVTLSTWHVVQHEGFHQFAAAVIGGELPIWVNEGLAEYFGEAVFTGDSFVDGVIPAWRLVRLRKELDDGSFKSVNQMMALSHAEWNAEMNVVNYDQAWSMVQFLAHGEDGRYQRAFARYMWLLGHRVSPPTAWSQTFGDTRGFQQRWEAWLRALPPEPTSDLYAQSVVATLTSFLGRAIEQQKTFPGFDQFLTEAGSGSLTTAANDWLPTSLLDKAVKNAQAMADLGDQFELQGPAAHPDIFCKRNDGTNLRSHFILLSGKVAEVKVELTPGHIPFAAPTATAPAER